MKNQTIAFAITFRITLTSLCLCALMACDTSRSTSMQDNIDTTAEKARFNPGESIIPFPSDLLFNGSEDGTLNIPVANRDDYSDPQVAMNTAWGFATDTSMSTSFTSSINAASINGDSVRVYEVTLSQKPGGDVAQISGDERLTYGLDYVASVSVFDPTVLVITPLRPLNYDSSYLVVVTSALRNTSGVAYKADLVYGLLKLDEPLVDGDGNSLVAVVPDRDAAAALEDLRRLTNINETTITGFDNTLSREEIILSWTFTTQPAGPVLAEARALVSATPVSNINSTATMPSPGTAAAIHVGTLQVPYYLEAPSQGKLDAPLNSFWKDANGSFLTPISREPVKNGDQTIPLLVSIPNDAKPAGGWPVVIFQHGITANRTNLLGVADALAAAGFAAVAIDLPLHGITAAGDNYQVRAATVAFDSTVQERLFDVDYVNNSTQAPGSDGNVDDSGAHFINLRNLAVTRDNVRQGVADLFTLTQALQSMDYDGDTGNTDFDASRIYFLGHSLGAIVGSVFLAMEPDVQDAVLAMPGASLAKLLDGSAAFGPAIAAGLAANGVVKGTADYEAFLMAAQTVVDSADPINYVDRVRNNRGILLFEVIADAVIPNTVPAANSPPDTIPAPLAGTTPFAKFLGFTPSTASVSGTDVGVWVNFHTPDNIGAAHHGSILTPLDAFGSANTVSQAVFTEMQQEASVFLASDGDMLSINDNTYIVVP